MDSLTKNPGFLHISEKIFLFLNHDNLMNCRLVNRSWKNVIENPIFWIKKCNQKGLSKQLYKDWTKVIQKSEYNKQCITRWLMLTYRKMIVWGPPQEGVSLIIIASQLGLLEVRDSDVTMRSFINHVVKILGIGTKIFCNKKLSD